TGGRLRGRTARRGEYSQLVLGRPIARGKSQPISPARWLRRAGGVLPEEAARGPRRSAFAVAGDVDQVATSWSRRTQRRRRVDRDSRANVRRGRSSARLARPRAAALHARRACLERPPDATRHGHAARVMMQFPRDFAERAAPRAAFIHYPSAHFETFWAIENVSFVQWTAWAGGPKAQQLARESTEQRKHLALASLAALLERPEASLEDALVCPIQHHDFSNDPAICGAYSFCRPGGVLAAPALSAPVGGALFLAGEATDHEYPGTVAGAIESGKRAAARVLAVLSR